MSTWLVVSNRNLFIITVITAVLLSVLLTAWITRTRSDGLETRMQRAESHLTEATENLRAAQTQLEAHRGRSDQFVRDQRVHNEQDAERRDLVDAELGDMRSELKMLRQSVFTMRPAAKSKSRRR